ncbi:hypothetical protein [Burkholderia ubonensis]|uniref:hypothetical protein n=1 Tax=Burkholderia ubonensis TaxID=101571 RepID=UPI000752BA47|nr:hypothetical protein [Burkholderia ubonensis]KVL10771.1 hypothetical protein WJ45_02620 [Burkholderia ubonensis]KVQ56561.1 hypothetical protein WK04_30650 [Burkholderia ubonensis]
MSQKDMLRDEIIRDIADEVLRMGEQLENIVGQITATSVVVQMLATANADNPVFASLIKQMSKEPFPAPDDRAVSDNTIETYFETLHALTPEKLRS